MGQTEDITVLSNGDILVAEPTSGRLSRFNAGGAFLNYCGVGYLSRPTGLAHRGSRYYVADAGSCSIFNFDDGSCTPNGSFSTGLACTSNSQMDVEVAADGDLLVTVSEPAQVMRWSPDGSTLRWARSSGSGPLARPIGVAERADGSVTVGDSSAGKLVVFSGAGVWLRDVATATSQYFNNADRLLGVPNGWLVSGYGRYGVDVLALDGSLTCHIGDPGTGVGLMGSVSGGTAFTADGKLLIVDATLYKVMVYGNCMRTATTTPTATATATATPTPAVACPVSDGMAASQVIGQTVFTANAPDHGGAVDAQGLFVAFSVWTDGVRMAVADRNNHRVLLYNTMPSGDGALADAVLGQSSMSGNLPNEGGAVSATGLHTPSDVYFDGTQLFVADQENHRVLVYNGWPATHAAADVVLGQTDKVSALDPGPTLTSLSAPFSVYSDGIHLAVADPNLNRVGIYDLPLADGAAASLFLGQADAVSASPNRGGSVGSDTLNTPYGVRGIAGRLYIADSFNHRVLIYNSFPTLTGQGADSVLGQPNTAASTVNAGIAPDARTLDQPMMVQPFGTGLLVADTGNNRVLVYDSLPGPPFAAADHVLGQADFSGALVNRGASVGADTLNTPTRAFGFGGNIYVSDTLNHRVLVYGCASEGLSAGGGSTGRLGGPKAQAWEDGFFAAPNPADATATFFISSAQAGPAAIRVLDVNGSLVRTLELGDLGPGQQQVRLATVDLAPGIYFAVLSQGLGQGALRHAFFKLAVVH